MTTSKQPRTTHSDLAREITTLSTKLQKIPQGYCVSDPSTLKLLTDAARILVELDNRIGQLVIELRDMRAQRRQTIRIVGTAT